MGRLPLAVELAAARAAVLAPADLLARLEASSDVLRNPARDAPERHRSLRATFEWTHGLLDASQQDLFRRMGAFAGPVPLDAAEAVAGPAALDGLEALLEFSLLRRVESPEYGLRFTMPQALRDFARGKLAASGEEDAVRRLHAQHVRAVADGARVWFVTRAVQQRVLALDAETRPALAWAQAHDGELYREMVAALGLGLLRRGLIRELLAYCERADERLDATGAWVIVCHAYALLMARQLEAAEVRIAPAIEYFRAHGGARELGLALHVLCWIVDTKNEERAIAIAHESLELLRETGDPLLEARGAVALVQVLINQRHLQEAKQAIELTGPVRPVATAETWWGDIALLEGDPAGAAPHYAASLEIAEADGDRIQMINDATLLAVSLLRAGELLVGLEIAGASAAMAFGAGHGGLSYNSAYEVGETIAEARAAGGEAGEAAYERGRALQPAEQVPRTLSLAYTRLPIVSKERGQ